ncbi:NAD-dependent epimerase/dehydratase family protein [Solimonas marina]|uniref:NAD-dependent epimerase/dehydratase family protein n=1 Tax=Solimonas marina TaxID=2714601 RepID=A0A969WC38_9GAMM|nr:NAD-dependent epimerase/dehydratase family protein [Solimonas marina]NKF22696.1 NAD-dependent epimerase/dehydratase family protein [Solimonas marina]
MAKTAFVTGSTGFVGLNLIEELHAQGWNIIAMHREASDVTPLARFAGVERVFGDITDQRTLRNIIPRHVDCLFHVAGNTSMWNRVRVEQIKVNVRGTRNIVRAALEAGVRRFVHTSSIVAYGVNGGTITEDTPTRASTDAINYVRSKALAEREVRKGVSAGLPAVIMNPSNIIGAYDTSSWSRLFTLVRQGRLPAMPPGGGSFCHAREVARMHVAAAEQGRIGANYLLGGAQASYVGLVREIARLIGVRRRSVVLHPRLLQAYATVEEWAAPLFGREPDITRDAVSLFSENFYCSSDRARSELGYQPQTLERMLSDCRDWLYETGRLKH